MGTKEKGGAPQFSNKGAIHNMPSPSHCFYKEIEIHPYH